MPEELKPCPMNAAIEAAARAVAQGNDDYAYKTLGFEGNPNAYDGYTADAKLCAQQIATAAIIAFLRNCETVTPAMVDALEAQFQHWKNDTGTNGPIIRANAFWQVLRETVATELEGK